MFSALLRKISHFDSNHRLTIALLVATLTFFVVPAPFFTSIHLTIVWIAFASTVLLLAWVTIFIAHPRDLPSLSRMEDSSRTLILVFAIAAAMASLFAVIDLLGSTNKQDPNQPQHVLLAALAVISAWSLVHTVFTLRYAHLYYGNDEKQKKRPGGLDFPHEEEPDFLDFAYFSFVIGMTSQVSDVAIGSKIMRRTALAHGVLSFAFNAIIVALTISGLSGLI
ncbi:DUF1345 domain-containing protein [Spirosoma validum]|uniref:DUF1345 domain-containing protein n=1 Tax=Spirosoma validum TaxID=2771355 RepID=A0A927B6Y7_9BACT|nr:DUF1345 domain-containing protein [Spirosoma validum]MBD2756408.1 DUF1345 domain-containing protein [Spirosoma validum]